MTDHEFKNIKAAVANLATQAMASCSKSALFMTQARLQRSLDRPGAVTHFARMAREEWHAYRTYQKAMLQLITEPMPKGDA